MSGDGAEVAGAGVVGNVVGGRPMDRKTGSDLRREGGNPRSELSVRVAVTAAARWAFAGLHEDALHGLPQAVLAGPRHSVHLHLAVDGPPILLPSHREQRLSGPMAETHGLLAPPCRAAAQHRPLVQVVAFAFVTKRAHLLRASGGERRVRTETSSGAVVCTAATHMKVGGSNPGLKPCVCVGAPQVLHLVPTTTLQSNCNNCSVVS